jgi:serine protease
MTVRSLLAAFLAVVLFPLAAQAQRTAPPDAPTDRLIVKWKKGALTEARLARLSERAGVRLARHRAMSGGAEVLKLDRRRGRGEARALAARLAQDPEVEYAVADEKRFPFATPNDGYFTGGLQSNLSRMNVPFAWDVTTGDANLLVAVIDTGVLPHPDLAGRTLPGHDFVTDPDAANDGGARDASAADPGDYVTWADVQDPDSPFDSACLYGGIFDTYSSWHGTHMAGIIGAVANNSNGIAGINWNSKILPVRVLGKCGGYDSDIIDGMRWAAGFAVPGAPANTEPAKVLNLSLGGPGACSAAWQAAINDVTALDKVVVVAAGNEGVDFATVSPASCQGVIAVAAFNFANERSFYSNFATAPAPHLFAAPGDNIYSTSDGGAQSPLNDGMLYAEYGTSGAAAQVSGIVSLMLSANPALTQPQVLQQLRNASTSLGEWAGSGRIDALRAVGNSVAFHGSVPVPVSMTINGASEVFEIVGGNFYTATVTWSDAAVTQVYPLWSLTAPFAPQATMSTAGRLPEFSVNADQTATVHASFTANGVTATADKNVLVKDNYVVSISASGPTTVYANNPAPAKFSATATWRDGRVVPGDVTWSVFSGTGSISAAGLFFAGSAGPVTVRATHGSLTADAPTTVEVGTPTPGAITLSCPTESVTGLTLDQLNALDVGSSADIIPLCDGKVLLADRTAKRVDVVDVRTGTVARSWDFTAYPTISRMELASGSSKVFISFFGSGSGLASIDLANPDNPPVPIALPAAHSADYIASLVNGDDGQIWVLHSQNSSFLASLKLTRYQVSDGAELATHDLIGNGEFMQYAKQQRVLVTAHAASGGSRRSYDVSPAYAFTQREFLTDAGGVLAALSPDGTRLLLSGKDLDISAMTVNRGTWSGAGSGGFSPDGKRLAANDINTSGQDLVVYSAERHLALKRFAKPEDQCFSHVATRFSPSGAFLYGYELCGFSQEYGRLFWVALGEQPTPDPFVFEPQIGVSPGAPASSNAVLLSGFNTAPISISGGEYSLDGGASFTSDPSTVAGNQSVIVRTQAPAGAYATATATLQVGAAQAQFLVTTGAALPAQWWSAAGCATEADLGEAALSLADIDPAWDMIALCDGRVLVGNRKLHRIELYDVRAGSAVKTWLLNAAPEALRLVPGTSLLLAVTTSSEVASVNLDTGEVNYIRVGGRVFDAVSSEPGQMIAVKQKFPSNNTVNGDTMTFHDIATGGLLQERSVAFETATHVRYDPVAKRIYTGNQFVSPARLSRFAYTPATHEITLEQYSLDAGDYAQDLVLSPDRTRIAYPVLGGVTDVVSFNAADLQPGGRWRSGPFPRAADFRADGAKILIGNEVSGFNKTGMLVFDVATGVLERYWIIEHCDTLQGKTRRVRFSPSGKYAYALETCGSSDGTSARLFWIPTASASTMPQPDPVAFNPRSGVALNADVTSNEIMITGLQGLQLPVSITGGQYSVFGGAFRTTSNGTVKDGDRIVVHQTAWFAGGVTTTTTLNVAGALFEFKATTTGAPGTDTMPDPFRLFVLKNRPLDIEFVSNTVVITGIDAPAPISIAGGSYSIDGGAFTAAAGAVNNGQLVTVKLTSANAINTASSAVLTVGGFSTSLSVTTGATDTTPEVFAFPPRPRVPRARWIESSPVAIAGLDGPVTASIEGGEFRVGIGAFSVAARQVDDGAVVTVRVMSSATLGETSTATLSVGPRSAAFSVTAGAAVHMDVSADGRSDILWRNSSSGENYLYVMSGLAIASEGYLRTVPVLDWQIVAMGDFDGDGDADLLWRNAATGENYVYLMNDLTIANEGYLRTVPVAWQVSGSGDFDGDGRADILWRNPGTGETYVYLMDGLSIVGEGYLRTVADTSWQVAGIGDFDGDGNSDVLWRNGASGENYVYFMSGLSIVSEGYVRTVPVSDWQIAGIGDFDGDGKDDVLWRNSSTGENYMYLMDGLSIVGEGYLRTVADTTWQIVAVGDYDGDGKSDLLWRNSSSGHNYLFPMDGAAIKPSEGYLRTVPPGEWAIVGK